jgi:HTH-type transcriptional regulator / antitoxin HigA
VSEFLAGKRGLSLPTIRMLHERLGIPAESLLADGNKQQTPAPTDFSRFPIAAMKKNGAFDGYHGPVTKAAAEKALEWLRDAAGGAEVALAARTTAGSRVKASLDPHAIAGWALQVLKESRTVRVPRPFKAGLLGPKAIRELVSLSVHSDGPARVQPFLADRGIAFVTVPHLPHTYLDGAVLWPRPGRPVLAMTLRYDKLDNFWFVLLHEIGHIVKAHGADRQRCIFDALDMPPGGDAFEQEADAFAAAALLPADFNLHRREDLTAADIVSYAQAHAVSPAIVAGRIQHERKDYRTFANLIGRGELTNLFLTRA